MIKEMDLINELASKNDNIFSNMRYNKYKESVNEIKGNYVISNFRFQTPTFRDSQNKFKYG